jgi:hypothetical protein
MMNMLACAQCMTQLPLRWPFTEHVLCDPLTEHGLCDSAQPHHALALRCR